MPDTARLSHPDQALADVHLVQRVRPLRRGEGEVQFGIDPDQGVVLAGLTEAEVCWLLSLAPGPARRDALSSRRPGQGWGVDPRRATHLLDLLRAHGLVRGGTPGTLPARGPARVAVLGEGPLAARVRAQVRLSGLARVDTGLGQDPAEMAILVVPEALASHEAHAWGALGTTHLPVLFGATWASVGPLVGRPDTPCLRCVDLARRDLDPAWPVLVDQIAGHRGAASPLSPDPAVTSTVCGVVGMLLRAHLAGRPVPAGVSWGVRLPFPQVLARRWVVHPRCDTVHGVPAR